MGDAWDAWTIGLLATLFAMALACGAVSCVPQGKLPTVVFRPRVLNWSLASALAVILAVVVQLVYSIAVRGLDGYFAETHDLFLSGLTAGVAALLTVLFAFFTAGAHTVVGMSRDAAWKVHHVFGVLMLIIGALHGNGAHKDKGDAAIYGNVYYLLGEIGLVLMYIGIAPALLHSFSLLRYDRFKVLHFLSWWGYVLVVVHMLDHAVTLNTARSWVVSLANLAAIVGFIAQKVWVKVRAPKVTVDKCEVVTDAGGDHIFLSLNVPGFTFAPGQFAHLKDSPFAAAPHPFTIVPGKESGQVQFFIKVSGPSTQTLARSCREGAPSITLEGPYGRAPLQNLGSLPVVFVVGGVGVTPALSLVKEAMQLADGKVRLFWALRSPELLARSTPFLSQAGLRPEQCSIHVTGARDPGDQRELGAKYVAGRPDLAAWIQQQKVDLSREGANAAFMFVCGPGPLVKTVKRTCDSFWHLHVEEFSFLPSLYPCGQAKTAPAAAAAEGNVVGRLTE